MTLDAWAGLPDGAVLASGTGLPSLVALVAWQRPRRPRARDRQVAWAVGEAELLGVAGLGGLSTHGRALVAGDQAAAIAALAPLLPEPVDHILLQADLTAVAPGRWSPPSAAPCTCSPTWSRAAAPPSTGSPRRRCGAAFDAGWSAAEVHDFIGSISRTAVPQPLSYLVDDTARTFGTLRVGHAEAFLRADDEAALTELLHHPKAHGLGLRRLAPTVLVSSIPLDVLLPRLRELGAGPVVEAADGTVRVARPDQLRARSPRGRRASGQEARETSQVAAAVSPAARGRPGRRGATHPGGRAHLTQQRPRAAALPWSRGAPC